MTDEGACATDQAAGTAGVKLAERPDPQAAINDVVVQVHASGFTGDEQSVPPEKPASELSGAEVRARIAAQVKKAMPDLLAANPELARTYGSKDA